MRRWRLGALALLALLAGAPLAALTGELVRAGEGPREEFARQAGLALNTLLLAGGTLALALPVGSAAAVLVYRTDLPGRHFFRFITLLTLFIPLPVLASAWQASLGARGTLAALWPEAPGRVWASGLGPAVWIHAAAALPWVVLIVGQGLCRVERELEEDALLSAGPWRVLWRVTLPRCRVAFGAAALFVALFTAAEIAVADLMQVRTFAEEVYLEFSFGGDAAGRAARTALPGVAVTALLVLVALRALDRAAPPADRFTAEPRPFPLGRWQWPALAAVLVGLAVLVGVPILSLLWQAGLRGSPEVWSAAEVIERVGGVAITAGPALARSAGFALLCGALAAGAALVLCWLALESWTTRAMALGAAAVLWALPAPLVGAGLKEVIQGLVRWSPDGPLATALYHGPSPLPVLWANLLRFLPLALAVLWPVVRSVPRELRDSARVDGAAPRQELQLVIWPLTRGAAGWAALVVAALALGEVGAVAVRVETPGWETYAHVLFDRMHYGTRNDVAGMCLLLILAVAAAGAAVFTVRAVVRRLTR